MGKKIEKENSNKLCWILLICGIGIISMLAIFYVDYRLNNITQTNNFILNTQDTLLIKEPLQSQDVIKMTQEFYSNQFSNLLALIAVFGVIVPFVAYMLQRQSLKDEKAKIIKDTKKEITEAKNEIATQKSIMTNFIGLYSTVKLCDLITFINTDSEEKLYFAESIIHEYDSLVGGFYKDDNCKEEFKISLTFLAKNLIFQGLSNHFRSLNLPGSTCCIYDKKENKEKIKEL